MCKIMYYLLNNKAFGHYFLQISSHTIGWALNKANKHG